MRPLAAMILVVLFLASTAPIAVGAREISEPRPVVPLTLTSTTITVPTCLEGGSSGPRVSPGYRVAAIKPIFTSTPYSQYEYGSFYAFYQKYFGATGNITTDLDWLNTSVISGMGYNDGWGHTSPLYSFLSSKEATSCGLVRGKNLFMISDINVSDGALFDSSGNRLFDAAIIGHQEYVTQSEYDQLRHFVASGGLLIAISSNEFYARVAYNPVTMAETFVVGHGGFNYNGHTAWYGKPGRTPWNSSGWFGSVFCCFHKYHYNGAIVNTSNPVGGLLKTYYGDNLFQDYTYHEENAVSNLTDTAIVATFNHLGLTVASYVHYYGRGAVACFCVFGEDIIAYDSAAQFFVIASLTDALSGSPIRSPPFGPSTLLVIAVGLVAVAVAAYAVTTLVRLVKTRWFIRTGP